MKARFTSNVFLVVAFFFVLALAGCKMKELSEDESDAMSDHAPVEVQVDEPEAVRAAGELGGMPQEENSLSRYQATVKVGAHAKYLKRYEAGQRVFILSPGLTSCKHQDRYIDCGDGLGRLLVELSQACEIAEIDTVNGGFFIEFLGAGSYSYKAGVTATTALVIRVSSCGEKKTE